MTDNLVLKIKENAERVDKELGKLFEGSRDEDIKVIFDAEKYSLLGGGKRIRAFITIEVCRMLGGNEDAALRFACALEMIHAYSLIHDDLPCMDNDDMRRGKPTNHKVFGYSTALLAGDALLTKAFGVAAGNPFVTPELTAKAVEIMAELAGDTGMIGGQIMDLAGEEKRLELEQIKKLHRMKTGALIRCAAYLGCISAGLTPRFNETKQIAAYAENIGLVFQIVDDILDVIGDERSLGKNINSDADSNKSTFMTWLSVEEAKAYAEQLTADAIVALSDFKEEANTLRELATYLLERQY